MTTRQEAKQKLVKISEFSQSTNLHFGAIFTKDPILNTVHCRTIYSEDRGECRTWLFQLITPFYRACNIPFASYLDGELFASEGILF